MPNRLCQNRIMIWGIDFGFKIMGIPLWHWVVALLVATAVYFALVLGKRVARERLAPWTTRTPTRWDDFFYNTFVIHTRTFFLIAVGIWLGSLTLSLHPSVHHWLAVLFTTALWVQVAFWGNYAISFWILTPREGRDGRTVTAYQAIAVVLRILLFVVIGLLLLANFGADIRGLLAGVGVAGIAVALAVQNILGDLFASFSIMLDKPFVVGDFIGFDDGNSGTVERIGIKTTRIRALSGEQLVFSNTDLLKSRIHNYGDMPERRVSFQINVAYETPLEQLQELPALLHDIVTRQAQVRFDRAHFARYGDYGLTYEIVYYVLSADYYLYMDVQQAINLEIFHRLRERQIRLVGQPQAWANSLQGLRWATNEAQETLSNSSAKTNAPSF